MTIIMVNLPFKFIYAPQVRNHLRTIDRKFYNLIKATIEEQLSYEPDLETKNRKPLSPASEYGEWEIRFGPKNRFRVIYRFSIEKREVTIGAIGEKRGNRFLIAGEEILL